MDGFLLAYIEQFRVRRRQAKQCLVRQVVIEHRVGLFEDMASFAGDEIRIARPGSNQIDRFHTSASRPGAE